MVHRVSQRKLSLGTNERRALLRNLVNSLILHEKIVTTEARAKTVRPLIEKLITKSKENTLESRRYLLASLSSENVVRKLVELIGPIFKERTGGYTRIIKLPPRAGDAAKMAVLEFVENVSEVAARKKIEEKPPKQMEQKAKRAKVSRAVEKKASQKPKQPTKIEKKETKKQKV